SVLHSSVLSLVLWFLIVSSTIDQRKDSFYQLFKVRKILYVIFMKACAPLAGKIPYQKNI
ncbi:MAG: hypothetical protein WC770_09960, partial [Phycisphaerae bacterium]